MKTLKRIAAGIVWLAQYVANQEPVRVAGWLGGLGVALAAKFGIDQGVAQSVVPGVVALLLTELARARVSPAKGIVTLHVGDDGQVVAPVQVHADPTPRDG
jgi:hypothetical protein